MQQYLAQVPVIMILMFLFALTPDSQAAKFSNRFLEFEAPNNWTCLLEGAEWVCQNKDQTAKREAIIILAAKLKGPQDSIAQFIDYLEKEKRYTSIQGKPVKSEKKYTKELVINEWSWADSLHLESELPGFYTRYLATTKEDIAVLVTYSIAKDKYATYKDTFDNMVKTLKAFRQGGGQELASGNMFDRVKVKAESVFGESTGPSRLGEGTIERKEDFEATSVRPRSQISSLLLLAGMVIILLFVFKRMGKK